MNLSSSVSGSSSLKQGLHCSLVQESSAVTLATASARVLTSHGTIVFTCELQNWRSSPVQPPPSTLDSLSALASVPCPEKTWWLKVENHQLWGGLRRAPEATASFQAAQAALWVA